MHFKSTTTAPLTILEQTLQAHRAKIEQWFEDQFLKTQAPLYTSVDIRYAGFKIAPVDANLFPAGFNNLSEPMYPGAQKALQQTLEQLAPGAKRVVLIPEAHTRNTFYWDNIKVLKALFEGAGFTLKLGGLVESEQVEALVVVDGMLQMQEGFVPDAVILNNDYSSDVPEVLQQIKQPLLPPLSSAWSHRLKSDHFTHYRSVAHDFSEHIGIDPWCINPLFRNCGAIDFMKREGEDCLVHNTHQLLQALQQQYQQQGIEQKPFVVVKADQGTYGMAVMMVDDIEQVRQLNRKQRTRMSKIKGGKTVQKVIIQEGVYTHEQLHGGAAEPVIYHLGQQAVGGFYRYHADKTSSGNLNAPGMLFEPFQAAASADDIAAVRYWVYTVVSRLAVLASGREIMQSGV